MEFYAKHKFLSIEITKGCNNNCKFCIYNHEKNNDQYIDYKFIDNFITDYIEKYNLNNMSLDILGGEPTVNTFKLIEILKKITKHKYFNHFKNINVVTNAKNLTIESTKEILNINNKILLSISYNCDVHGNNEKIIEFLNKHYNDRYCIYTVANIDDEKFFNTLKEIQDRFPLSRQRIFDDHRVYLLSDEEINKYFINFMNEWKKYIKYILEKYNVLDMPLDKSYKFIHLFYRGIENDDTFKKCPFNSFLRFDGSITRCIRNHFIECNSDFNGCERCIKIGSILTRLKRKIEEEVLNESVFGYKF